MAEKLDTAALDAIPPTVRVTNLGAGAFTRCSREFILNQLAATLSGGSPALVEDDAVASLLPVRPSERLEQILAATPQLTHLPSKGAVNVVAERVRQIHEEGWSAAHDDQHTNGQLARAGACYADPHNVTWTDTVGRPLDDEGRQRPFSPRELRTTWSYVRGLRWPWLRKWWKPGDRRRDLVKAAALIIAEIDRLDRMAQKGGAS